MFASRKRASRTAAFTRANRRHRKGAARPLGLHRLRIEPLEQRQMLSVITVTDLRDDTLANLAGNGISLREAIEAANTDTSVDGSTAGFRADTIRFDPSLSGGTINLKAVADDTNGPSALLISSPITIECLPGHVVTLTRDESIETLRLLFVNGDGDLTLERLTLSRGNAGGEDGGAILSFGGNLSIFDSTIQYSQAGSGGGVFFGSAGQALLLDNVVVRGNEASVGGGGLFVLSAGSDVTIRNSSLVENVAQGDGGGLLAAAAGGFLRLQGSSFIGNEAHGSGGGISALNAADMEIEACTIEANSAGTDGDGGGVVLRNSGTAVIRDSFIADNSAGYRGGGLSLADNDPSPTGGTFALQNSTVTGNRAWWGGGAYLGGSGQSAVRNSTIARNRAYQPNTDYPGYSGGLAAVPSADPGASITVQSSIIALNQSARYSVGYLPDIDVTGNVTIAYSLVGDIGYADPFVDGGHNLIGGGAVPSIDPLLSDPGDHGGPTWTCALLEGSPAIDQGSNPAGLANDQRGGTFVRESGAGPDMGAYESQALSLVVTTLDDELDPTFDPEDLSLREALDLANKNAAPDMITFEDGLTGPGCSITLTLGTLYVEDSVSILGPGAENLTIAGNPDPASASRLFALYGGYGDESAGMSATIDGLTLTGGNAGSGSWASGGAILSLGFDLQLRNSVLTGNTAGTGGAVFAIVRPGRTATIENCQITGNSGYYHYYNDYYGYDYYGGTGGGLALGNFGTLTIRNTTVSGNNAVDGGGGVALWAGRYVYSDDSASEPGKTLVENCTISGNSTSAGGLGGGLGIENNAYATTTIRSSTISGNSAGGNGGGIWAYGNYDYGSSEGLLQKCMISGERDRRVVGTRARANDVGDYDYGHGTTLIQDSTISGNRAYGSGGGIWSCENYYGATVIQNSTISGNRADGDGGGIWAFNSYFGVTQIQNSTITGNRADFDNDYEGIGGGLRAGSYYADPVAIQSTIIAGNADTENAQDFYAPDISGAASIEYSLVGDGSGAFLDDLGGGHSQVGDVANPIDPRLGPLGDNGGPTQTHALLAGSPAIDVGDNPAGLETDQRGLGFPRVVNDICDIGALESNGDDVTPPIVVSVGGVDAVGGRTWCAFTVTYADDVALDASSFDDGDVQVTSAKGYSGLAAFDHALANPDGSQTTVTYRIAPTGKVWGPSDNGTYTVTMLADEAFDTGGNPVAPGPKGTFSISGLKADKSAPTLGEFKADNVTLAGGDVVGDTVTALAEPHTFTVTYKDNVEMDPGSLDDLDVRVTGPDRYNQPATLVGPASVSPDGKSCTAIYQVMSPGASWTDAPNGVYTVTVQAKEVKDATGNAMGKKKLGQFTVDTVAPTASLAASNISSAKNAAKSYAFKVTCADSSKVSAATLADVIVRVTSPNGFSQPATVKGKLPAKDGKSLTVTYQITPPPGGFGNGVYALAIESGEVQDTFGNPLLADELGTFVVDTAGVAPTATLTTPPVAEPNAATSTFTVTYADDVAVNPSTVDKSDIKVAGPKYSQLAALLSVTTSADGKSCTATYQITAPGTGKTKVWDSADNGAYTVTLQPKQVKDMVGNAAAKASVLGTFNVSFPSAALAASGAKAAGAASLPPSREQAAMLAAADAAQRDRKTAAMASVFASIDDWLW